MTLFHKNLNADAFFTYEHWEIIQIINRNLEANLVQLYRSLHACQARHPTHDEPASMHQFVSSSSSDNDGNEKSNQSQNVFSTTITGGPPHKTSPTRVNEWSRKTFNHTHTFISERELRPLQVAHCRNLPEKQLITLVRYFHTLDLILFELWCWSLF